MSLWTTVRQSAQGGGTFLSKSDQKKIRDPFNLSPSRKGPEKPEPTAQMLALERRQQMALDKEIEEMERRSKMMARNRLGGNTLLSGAEPTQERMVTRGESSGGAVASGSLLGSRGSSSGGGSAPGGLIGRTSTRAK